jgi:hypothetical protein
LRDQLDFWLVAWALKNRPLSEVLLTSDSPTSFAYPDTCTDFSNGYVTPEYRKMTLLGHTVLNPGSS